MTSNDPDQIRADIERTRADLSQNVDALGDKMSPGQIAHRQGEKVKDAVTGVKEKVFGAADDASTSVGDRASGLSDSAHHVAGSAKAAPGQVRAKAEGNPLAAGVIAFGVGLLASSLIPSTRKERELATQAKESDAVQGVTEGAKGLAKEMGENLREPAKEAAEQVKGTATEGAQQVKSTATEGAQDVRATATEGAEQVKGEAAHQKDAVSGHAQDSAGTVREY